jgi:DNA-binding NtrC family response regulator
MSHILLVDDDEIFLNDLKEILSKQKYEIKSASNLEKAMSLLEQFSFDLIITDMVFPLKENGPIEREAGLKMIEEVKKIMPDISIIVLTGHAEMENAIKAMKAGACDYLTKPISSLVEIRVKIKNVVEKIKLKQENKYWQEKVRTEIGEMIGESPAWQKVREKIKQVASNDQLVLIRGETGVGKEIVARAIHYQSRRNKKPFIAVNIGSLSEHLLESELFGHEKGAFTGALTKHIGYFEMAHQSTLFLDEIGDLKPDLQVKLLRALQEGEIKRVGSSTPIKLDIRFITATHQNLEKKISKGTFREDLYYRLAVLVIEVPPLRERKEDIPLLTRYFVKKYSQKMNRPVVEIEEAVLEKLAEYNWPGNVRELENVVQRLIVNAKTEKITTQTLGEVMKYPFSREKFSFQEAINEIVKHYDFSSSPSLIETFCQKVAQKLLEQVKEKKKVAQLLKITEPTLRKWLKE